METSHHQRVAHTINNKIEIINECEIRNDTINKSRNNFAPTVKFEYQ